MKSLFSFWQRIGMVVTLLLLGACSALHVDVDVYKGPLANVEDTQLRQYATLAIAAKPIIAQLRNEYIEKAVPTEGDKAQVLLYLCKQQADKVALKNLQLNTNKQTKCEQKQCDLSPCDQKTDFVNLSTSVNGTSAKIYSTEEYIPIEFQMDEARFLNSVLALYKNVQDLGGGCAATCTASGENLSSVLNVVARDEKGLEALTQEFIEAENIQDKAQRKMAVNQTSRRLGNALIVFAEKILFFVNNRDLASTGRRDFRGVIPEFFIDGLGGLFGGEENQSVARKLAVLQSLGNTIIVHADDLRRRDDHQDRLRENKGMELSAAKQSIALSSSQAFTNLLNEAKTRLVNASENKAKIEDIANANVDVKKLEKEVEAAKTSMKNTIQSSIPALATYRTLYDSFSLGSSPVEDDKVSENRTVLNSILTKADNTGTFVELLKQLCEKIIELQSPTMISLKPFPEEDRRLRLVKAFLGKSQVKNLKILGASNKAMSDAFKEKLLIELKEAQKRVAAEQKIIDEIEPKIGALKLRLAKSVADKEPKSTLTLATLEGVRSAVLSIAAELKISDMSGIRGLMLQELSKKLEKTPADTTLKDAIAELKQIQSHTLLSENGLNGEIKTQVDVLDEVIAQLRYMQIQAKASGAPVGQQESIANSLALAYEHRGGFAFLRSTSTYLRNAYANTAFQDARSNQSNLIKPKFGFGSEYNRAERETKLEIDKQYWQNINSIKLSGSGASNYALVKDDIGNWYVKAYESDSEVLFKSAQSLALFNMGGKINVNLLQQLNTQKELDKATGDERDVIRDRLDKMKAGNAANTEGISNVTAKFREKYQESSIEQLRALHAALTNLPSSIKTAWSGISFDKKESSMSVLSKILDSNAEVIAAQSAITLALDDVEKKKAAPENVGDLLANGAITALRQIRNMRVSLVGEIMENADLIKEEKENSSSARKERAEAKDEAGIKVANSNVEAAEKLLDSAILNRRQAAQKLASVINNLIEITSKNRLDTVRAYDSAITIIGLTVEGK